MSTEQNWLRGRVVGLSVSESEDLLARGFGREHLREFLIRLSRRLLRAGADLAYGGHFRRRGSFTRDLIELISEEQREGIGDQRPWIGVLYNHSAWPHYLDISDDDEANFVDACRFVRITQEMAGIPPEARVADPEDPEAAGQVRFNRAVVVSRMRRAMAEGLTLHDPRGRDETIPAVAWRVLVAGKTTGFSGILPGLYEELLYCFEAGEPVYLLGAYGGAGGRLAGFLSGRLERREASLDLDVLHAATPALAELEADFDRLPWAAEMRRPAQALEALIGYLDAARKDIPGKLGNGLSRDENLRLFATADTAEAAELILRGLARVLKQDDARAATKKKARPARRKARKP